MKSKLLKVCVEGIAAALIFSSCTDFLEGSLLKTEIDNAIEDANTERVGVQIKTLNSYGTLTGETGGTYKIGTENLKLGFSENKGYQFVEWKVYDSSENNVGCSSADPIFISNPYSAKTNFSILKSANGYRIEPVCAVRPAVEIASPSYIASGVNSDSAIEVTFVHSVDESNFIFSPEEFAAYGQFAKAVLKDSSDETSAIVGIELAGEKIYKNIFIVDSDGKNISSHYKAPVLSEDGKKLILEAETSRSFDFNSMPTKDVFVTVSQKIGYDYETQNEKIIRIVPEKFFDYNFKISSTTTAKAKINFSAKDNEDKITGTLTYNGLHEFNIGQTVQIEFVPNKEFIFVGWDVLGNEDNAVLAKADGSSLLVKVLKSTDELKIVPVCEEKTKAQLLFTSSNGIMNPSGYVECMQDQLIPLSFSCDPSYKFIQWKVVNTVTGETVEKAIADLYYEFADENSQSTFVTIKNPKDVYSIVADCYVRPHVFSHYPDIVSGSSIRLDQCVKIYFDHDMDKMSFYYSEAEVVQVQKINGFNGFLKDSTGRYGYETLDGDKVYKNISITNRNTGDNYAKYYKQPELIDPRTLVVPVNVILKSKNEVDFSKSLPKATEVMFQLGDKVGYYAENGELVPLMLDSNLTWFYTNNGTTDSEKPVIVSCSLKTSGNDPANISQTEPTSTQTLKAAYLSSGLLDYDIKVKDPSANLSALTLKYARIKTIGTNLDSIPATKIDEHSVTLNLVSGDKIDGTCNGSVDFFELSYVLNKVKSYEGVYKLWIEVMDESGNTNSSTPYYIVVDKTSPEIDFTGMKFFRNGSKIKFCDWNISSKPFDYESTTLYVKQDVSSSEVAYPMDGVNKYIFNFGYIKTIRIVAKDIFGNEYKVPVEAGEYNAALQNGDWFYTNGWFSAKSNPYSDYTLYGIYNQNYIYPATVAEKIHVDQVNAKLKKLNDEIPALLKGKMTWSLPDETRYFPWVPTGIEPTVWGMYYPSDVHFFIYDNNGKIQARYYNGTSQGYIYDPTSGYKDTVKDAYFVPEATLPTGDFE